jgi:hypothetical protein
MNAGERYDVFRGHGLVEPYHARKQSVNTRVLKNGSPHRKNGAWASSGAAPIRTPDASSAPWRFDTPAPPDPDRSRRCASETNAASNCEGARNTPPSSMRERSARNGPCPHASRRRSPSPALRRRTW